MKEQRRRSATAELSLRTTQRESHRETIQHDMKLQAELTDEIQDMRLVREARAKIGSLLNGFLSGMDKVQGPPCRSCLPSNNHARMSERAWIRL